MTMPYLMLNRRRFLQFSLYLSGLFINLRSRSINAASDQQAPALEGYGASVYGQGEYPSYKIYLSLITKEGK